jgi:hypothetical protein
MAVQVERTNAESNLTCAPRTYSQTRVYGICVVGSVNAAREDVHVTSGLMVTNDDGTAELHIEGIFNTRYKRPMNRSKSVPFCWQDALIVNTCAAMKAGSAWTV